MKLLVAILSAVLFTAVSNANCEKEVKDAVVSDYVDLIDDSASASQLSFAIIESEKDKNSGEIEYFVEVLNLSSLIPVVLSYDTKMYADEFDGVIACDVSDAKVNSLWLPERISASEALMKLVEHSMEDINNANEGLVIESIESCVGESSFDLGLVGVCMAYGDLDEANSSSIFSIAITDSSEEGVYKKQFVVNRLSSEI